LYYLYCISLVKYSKFKMVLVLHHYYHSNNRKKHCLFVSHSLFNRYAILIALYKSEM
jgi:hypothetical protein